MNTDFEIKAERLIIRSDLVLSRVAELQKRIGQLDLSAVSQLDLSAVKALDSAGIALLLTLQQELKGSLSIISPPAHLVTLLGLYNLESQFKLDEQPE
ncbi:STAS domain-containing protein [Thiomicrospira microaerophila]|uniref:STAS domain-containing protein n=1 Tax=Thiomicrospira microaerophila TaxID=406020 RepID=UPI00200C65C9|nr:STAS domain-containing protein [Thiomicrospira microaerophila]UQB42929.1 STAS domain-containing protein [Thiomicrospira microaerophila]